MAIKLYEATKGDICSNLEYDGSYTISIEELEGLMSYLQIEIDKIKKGISR